MNKKSRMKNKQRLSSYDAPNPIPASLESLDLSHAIDSFEPKYQYDLDDIPGLPIFKPNGKFKRIVSSPVENKRIFSMPSFSLESLNKELPSVPMRSVTNFNRYSMPVLEEASETNSTSGVELDFESEPALSSANTSPMVNLQSSFALAKQEPPQAFEESPQAFDKSPQAFEESLQAFEESPQAFEESPTFQSAPCFEDSQMYERPLPSVNLLHAFTSLSTVPKTNLEYVDKPVSTKYIIDDDDDDIDSLFSSNKSKYSNVTEYSIHDQTVAESLLEMVKYYQSDDFSDTASTKSYITDYYIEEESNSDVPDDVLSVRDSLFSDISSSESVRAHQISNSVISLNNHGNYFQNNYNTNYSSSYYSSSAGNSSDSFIKIYNNSSSSFSPPLPHNNASSTSLISNKELPAIPKLNIKKSRVDNHESSQHKLDHKQTLQPPASPFKSSTPVEPIKKGHRYTNSVPNTSGIQRSNKTPANAIYNRPVSMQSTSNFSSASFMTSYSLNDAKSDMKQVVRQRPFSYCLDSSKDYEVSRYAPPLKEPIKSNPYRSPSLPASTPKTPVVSNPTFLPQVTPKTPTKRVMDDLPPTPPAKPAKFESFEYLSTPKKSTRSFTQPIQTHHSLMTPPASPPGTTFDEQQVKSSISSFLAKAGQTKRVTSEVDYSRQNRFIRNYD